MEMTKQRKLLLVVAGLGLGGLAVDKLLLGPPESAKADVKAVAQQAPAPVQQPPTDQPGDGPSEGEQKALPSYATLTERLIETADRTAPRQTGDPFAMPADWAPVITNTPGRPEQARDNEWSRRLLAQYKFYGTTTLEVEGEEVQLAVIRKGKMGQQFGQLGHMIRVETGKKTQRGEPEYEMYQLVKIDPRKVVWRSIENTEQTVEMQITVLGEPQ